MADFEWRAVGLDGRIVSGLLTAESLQVASRQLLARGLTPLRVVPASGVQTSTAPPHNAPNVPAWRRSSAAGKGPVNRKDVLGITSSLSTMIRAGVALDSALRVLIDTGAKPSVIALLSQLLADVKAGMPLSRALARTPELFGDFYINMVRAGEATGQLSGVLVRVVEHMERLRSLRDSLVSALTYPAILLSVAILSVIAMLGFVVPQFEKLFKDMGDALPLPTQVIMSIGQAFQAYGWVMLAAAAALAWLAIRWARTPTGRAILQRQMLRLPVVGAIVWKYELTLYARSLGTLVGNGVGLLSALEIASATVQNQTLRGALAGIIPAVKSGTKLADAARTAGVFDPLSLNLIRVGDETGKSGPMMLELADILNREVEIGIKRALTILEPAMILVLGVMVATIIVSILLGILSVNDLAL